MGEKEGSDFPVGYKRPPRHTRFKPGQSGNPHGRPKKKRSTFAESVEKELNALVTVKEGGTQRRMTKLQAIVKQQTNKAVTGDLKSTEFIIKAVEERESEPKDALSPMLRDFREIHARHEAGSAAQASNPAESKTSDPKDGHHEPD